MRIRSAFRPTACVALWASIALLPLGAARAAEPPPDAPSPPAPDAPAPTAPAPEAPAPEVPAAEAQANPVASPTPTGRAFEKPALAVTALIEAFEKNDGKTLEALLGSDSSELVPDGGDPKVAEERTRLARLAREAWAFDRTQESAGILHVEIGSQRFPLAMPVVKTPEGWRLDAAAGRAELLARRIGRNELEAIGLCRQYVEMQVTYAAMDRDGDGVREYAQRVASSPGAKDGLYWESSDADDEESSPLGLALSTIGGTGKEAPPVAPYGGYRWSILTAQGERAPGGAHSYVLNGNLIAGFALVAAPAEYRLTGVMTFVVNQDGRVFQKDLGPTTIEAAAALEAYDPDDTWTEVADADDDVDVTATSTSAGGGPGAGGVGADGRAQPAGNVGMRPAAGGRPSPASPTCDPKTGRPIPAPSDALPRAVEPRPSEPVASAPATVDPLGTFEVSYPDGERYSVTVPDRGTLVWKALAGTAEGKSGTETVDRRELAPNLWYVSWRQDDGTVTTQIVDLGKGTVLSTEARGGARTVLEGSIRRLP